MVTTRSKRAKRVLRCLSISQHQDQLLSPSTTPLIRYNLLHNYHRCRQVSIDLAEPADLLPNTVSYNELPKFLRSQLEAQKITDGSRLWSQIVPILTFIQASLRRFSNSRGFPTLFFWYSRENHRSYFFFAFVENKMPSKTYTSRELLRMRHIPAGKELYDQLQDRLRKDLELSDIFRMPLERSLPLIKEEPLEMRGNSDDDIPAKDRVSRQLDGTDSEWKYRGRTDSEHAETQPIPAPSGLVAQKDEGFQRFYKAVVSPTHVRVTAGGRIVPNTRGSSSPTAKWVKEKAVGEGASNGRPPNRDVPEQGHFPMHQAFSAFPPMFPGFAPGMVPGMQPGPSPFPMMPWHMGLNLGGAFGIAPHPLGQISAPRTMAQNSSKSDKQSDAGASENPTPPRVSPPEQFDHSRPFFYNGQWMMPPGAPFYPYHMPPAPGFQVPPVLGHAMAVHRFGPGAMAHSQAPRNAQAVQSQASNLPASALSSAPGLTTPAKPPISSIRPSEITKKQIDVLRGSLRYFEDQLQYNKHQIDEKSMEHQAQIVRHQIQHFEKNLEAHLAFEDSHYPKHEAKEDSSDSPSSPNGMQSKSPVTGNVKSGHDSDSASSSPDEASVVRAVRGKLTQKRSTSRQAGGSDSSNSTSAPIIARPTFSSPNDDDTAIRKSSTLPVTAALAPPFQPRATCEKSEQIRNETPTANGSSSNDNSKVQNAASIAGEPYLVGNLPSGISPELARDTDYMYPRDLTEDELRARHMYWGRAPHHLQSGFPKFDGKDFYPPSPAKGRSSEIASTLSIGSHGVPVEAAEVGSRGNLQSSELDPFQSSSQLGLGLAQNGLEHSNFSGSIPQPESSMTGVASASSHLTSPLYEGFGESRCPAPPSESPNAGSGNDESDDDKNLLFKGRNSLRANRTKSRNEIWQSMMRRGMSSGNVVPGTVSSTTAQGVLPHYGGHATASLAPAVTNTAASPRNAASKFGNSREGGSTSPVAERHVENRPPGDSKLNVHFGTSVFIRPTQRFDDLEKRIDL